MRRQVLALSAQILRHTRNSMAVLALLAGTAMAAPNFETAAPHAILMDYDSGTVLLDKDADQLTPPASLAKLMTVAVVFDQLEKGRISLDDTFTVSKRAWERGGAKSGGSTMFLPLNSQVSLRDLLRGIIVQSGNDASIVVAEGVAGSVENFAEMMNRRAKEIGLEKSNFTTPHGLPHPDQKVTMREMAKLADHLIREYPEYYKIYSEREFAYNGITQANRNPTLGDVEGADGLKTGHTSESGYALVASAERDGRRLILAMNGLESMGQRATEARKLLEWGFRAFEEATLFKPDEPVGRAAVYGGAVGELPLVAKGKVSVLTPRGTGAQDLKTEVVLDGPVPAPVKKGDRVGALKITSAGSTLREVPLYAGEDVEQGAWYQRAWDAAAHLVTTQVQAATQYATQYVTSSAE